MSSGYSPRSTRTASQLRRRALRIALGDLTISIAGRDDLIKMKRASGRPTDLADVAALTEPEQSGNEERPPPSRE